MKIQTSSLLLVTMSFFSLLHSATTAEFLGTLSQEPKEGVEQAQTQSSSVPTRSVSSDPAGSGTTGDVKQVKFTQTAYGRSAGDANTLYLGAEVVGINKKNYALSRTSLGVTNDGKILPIIDPLAPEKVTSNGTADQNNPLHDKDVEITHLALMGLNPVVTASIMNRTVLPATVTTHATDVFLIQDTIAGSIQITNAAGTILDAAGAAIDHSIAGLAASNREIFVAVPAAAKAFNADGDIAADPTLNNRGISVLRVDGNTLVPVEGMSGAANTNATKLDVIAYNLGTALAAPDKDKVRFAFFDNADTANAIARAKLGSNVALHWDENLRRLFIGVEASRNQVSRAGGVLNLAVARFKKDATTKQETDELVISPFVVSPTKGHFYDGAAPATTNVTDRIVGFYVDATVANNHILAIDKIRTMHTTTGKDYLIVAGRNETNPAGNKKGIYALPLLGTTATEAQVGTLAKTDFSAPAAVIGDMPAETDGAVRLGGEPLSDTVLVSDLFVVGDSVYVCLVGDISKNAGIFQSTAIFDGLGNIVGWTPFTRVMGSLERAYGAGLDPLTGSYLFLAETNDAKDMSGKPFFDPTNPAIRSESVGSIRRSSWGETDSVNDLGAVLKPLFPQAVGGIFQLITFDEKTPGFSIVAPTGHLSVMVAVGFERVALIQTGKQVTAAVGGAVNFVPETTFQLAGANQNVFVRNDQALKEIGPICTADFARSTNGTEGWLFVGGYDGVAVLRQGASGQGFNSNAGLPNLSAGGFPGAGYTFKKLVPSNNGDLTHVRKVACLERVLYILTQNNLYAIDMAMHAGKFNDAITTPLNEQNIFAIPGVALLDFIPLAGSALAGTAFRALLATTRGLFFLSRASGTLVATEVKVGGKSLGPVIQLQYLSQTKGAPSNVGNLFVLAADIAGSPSTGRVYRFHVTLAGGVTPIPPNNGLVADLGTFRGNFFADGSTVLHTRGKHFGLTDYLNAQPTADPTLVQPLANLLNVSEPNSSIGSVVRDSASGALYVPTDWGLRAHL